MVLYIIKGIKDSEPKIGGNINMVELLSLCGVIDSVVTIMAKMAFIFLAYKSIYAMNVYINKNNK